METPVTEIMNRLLYPARALEGIEAHLRVRGAWIGPRPSHVNGRAKATARRGICVPRHSPGGGLRHTGGGMAGSEWTPGEDGAGIRLDKFLAAPERLGSRARAVVAIERGKVFVNDREATMADAAVRLASGDRVRVWMDRPGSARARPRPQRVADVVIIYEDEALLVVDKPPGLLAVPLERKADAASVF